MSRAAFLHVSLLEPHPDNIRADLGDLADLAASIRVHGVLQPVIAEPHPELRNHYRVIAGHRRLEAAKLAKVSEIPVIVRSAALPPMSAVQVMLVENCQRLDLTPMDKAEAMGRLRDSGMTGRAIAQAISQSEQTVSLHLRLLDLDEPSRERLRSGDIGIHDAARLARETRPRKPSPQREPRARSALREAGRDKVRSGWEPPHFTSAHPLAGAARDSCNKRGHSLRGRLGKVACGACWEDTLRLDERGELTPPAQAPPPRRPGTPEYREWHAAYERERRPAS